MSKALRRDIASYELMRKKKQEKLKNQMKKSKNKVYQNVSSVDNENGIQEESKDSNADGTGANGDNKKAEDFVLDEIAWKKVKGDVFRRPKCSLLFSVLVGTGI